MAALPRQLVKLSIPNVFLNTICAAQFSNQNFRPLRVVQKWPYILNSHGRKLIISN